jgi:hypothetical protein
MLEIGPNLASAIEGVAFCVVMVALYWAMSRS